MERSYIAERREGLFVLTSDDKVYFDALTIPGLVSEIRTAKSQGRLDGKVYTAGIQNSGFKGHEYALTPEQFDEFWRLYNSR